MVHAVKKKGSTKRTLPYPEKGTKWAAVFRAGTRPSRSAFIDTCQVFTFKLLHTNGKIVKKNQPFHHRREHGERCRFPGFSQRCPGGAQERIVQTLVLDP